LVFSVVLVTTALDISLQHLFCEEPRRAADEREGRLESLIALLRGLDATDLELFNEMSPRLAEWKSRN
jgi:hypothetical protein